MFDKIDTSNLNRVIAETGAQIVFVSLTAPKQEKLIHQLSFPEPVQIASGFGAVFDFYAGNVKRPREFWRKVGLEWLIRFFGEPRRLFKRNFVSAPLFVAEVLRSLLNK